MRTTMTQHSFAKVPQVELQRSSFDRSHGYKTTFDAGYLVPFLVDEALPGDTFNVNVSAFARLATPIKAPMDNMFMDFFYFAVPYRLVWDNFVKMMGEQIDPGDSIDYLVPQMTAPAVTGHLVGSLSDYMGIPTGVASLAHSSLFHRAYNLIWNEWFRDENLQDSIVVDRDDGPDLTTDYALKRRGKRHDYFTSCLPWPQKGDAVTLPLGDTAPVTLVSHTVDTNPNILRLAATGATSNSATVSSSASGQLTSQPGGALSVIDPNGRWEADLTAATASTINSLREAFQLQRMLERDARGGTRYTELVRSHFGVVSPDARLQRPEFLGGGEISVNVHPVPQQSATGATGTPQGNVAGFGVAVGSGNGFVKSFTEHCLIIGLVSVRADLNYQQGLDRMFSRRTRYDFFWPSLAHLGEQAVLNKEIYAQGNATDDEAFGYQERFAEYRYKPSRITGQFRSTYASSLDVWHLAQEFGSLPTLGADFIQDDPPVDRVVQTPTEPHFLFDSHIRMNCARPMPVFGVPGLIDHF